MNKFYIKPEVEITGFYLEGSILGPGDAAATVGGDGDDGWANTFHFANDDLDRSDNLFENNQNRLWEE